MTVPWPVPAFNTASGNVFGAGAKFAVAVIGLSKPMLTTHVIDSALQPLTIAPAGSTVQPVNVEPAAAMAVSSGVSAKGKKMNHVNSSVHVGVHVCETSAVVQEVHLTAAGAGQVDVERALVG